MIFNSDPMPIVYHVLYKGDIEGTKGTMIEKYYDDFQHVKIVPFSDVLKVTKQESETFFGEDIYRYTQFLSQGNLPDENFVSAGGNQDFVNDKYRRIMKMQWLINDIATEGCREPIHAVMTMSVYPYDPTEFRAHVHPGSFRRHALQMMDRNDLCVVYDAYNIFSQEKASLSDVLELYNDEGTVLEIALLPTENGLNTPQILNHHKDSKNANMSKNIKKWEEKVRHLWDKPINIFIGYDSTHRDATNICHNSIQDNMGKHLNSHLKITHLDVSKIDGWTREYKNQSTEFSYSRFLVPYLSNYEGMSIFCDDDFIFTENILNLLYFIGPQHSVACVKHDFTQKYDTKFTNVKDVWYDKKLWSSLMVFNNSHPDCQKLTLESVQRESGQYLHQFEWTTDECIASLPHKWNWCEGYSDINKIHEAAGMHWTRGGPWIEGMDCSHIEGLHVYDTYKTRGIEGFDKWRQIIDIREYYDIDNPIEELQDNSLVCQEINRDVR